MFIVSPLSFLVSGQRSLFGSDITRVSPFARVSTRLPTFTTGLGVGDETAPTTDATRGTATSPFFGGAFFVFWPGPCDLQGGGTHHFCQNGPLRHHFIGRRVQLPTPTTCRGTQLATRPRTQCPHEWRSPDLRVQTTLEFQIGLYNGGFNHLL